MKINRLLSAALITLATVLTGCVKESVWDRETGIDESKAAPEGFTYDEEMSSKTTLAVYWDGQKAKAAGAKSFFVQLTDMANMDKGNSWDSKLTKVLEITEDGDYESAQFSGLAEYDCYYVRVRANYPGSVYSPWVYLTKEDGTPALMQIGHGQVALVPTVSATALVKEIEVVWTLTEGATKYLVEWKKTADSSWQSAETTETTYKITGLTPETGYDIKVTSITATEKYASDVISVTTKEQPPFPMTIETAQQWADFVNGEIIPLATATDVVTFANDLDFTGIQYATAAEFKGILDGNGKTIKNLAATTPLLKKVNQVKDLTIDASCSFTTSTAANFASLAEWIAPNGTVTNVKNYGSVTATYDNLEDPWVVGGLVAFAFGKIEGCENHGAVTATANSMNTGAMGGVVAYTEEEVNNSKNTGAVSCHFGVAGTKMKIYPTNPWTKAPSVGGIVGLAYGNFGMSKCENNGSISYKLDDITVAENYNRTQIGGIVGAPSGLVSECKNTGAIDILHTTPGRTPFTAKQAVLCVGGIGGGEWDAKKGDLEECVTSYVGCVNEGNITVESDNASGNSPVGGIVGWPGAENGNVKNETKDCINRGDVTIKGSLYGRFGGIQGGTGHIVNCENHGNISAVGCYKGSVLGSAAAFHSQNHKLEGTLAGGTVSAVGQPIGGIGGLIGNNGNAKNTTGAGCVVNCVINGGDETIAGMVVGLWNGTSSAVTLGPLEVSGTVNGAPASAANLCGTTNAAGVHVINATIK